MGEPMTGPTRPVDVMCLSYLAAVDVLEVERYPRPNHGALIRRTHASLAGDGPLVAVTATALGLTAGVIANPVGDCPTGRAVLAVLATHNVTPAPPTHASAVTPRLTVVTDDDGTRTWFADLADALSDLTTVDLTPLTTARLVYLDCYRVTADAAIRALRTLDPQQPLHLNLGGDQPDPRLPDLTRHRPIVVQTSLDEAVADQAPALATELHQRLRPHTAVVTTGAHGAVAHTGTRLHRHTPVLGPVGPTHGAGAVFSAAHIHARLAGADTSTALTAACETATRHRIRRTP